MHIFSEGNEDTENENKLTGNVEPHTGLKTRKT